MELSQLEAFVTIAQHQGFSRAAAVLHLSQPAISRRVSLLEDELGVSLFDRVHGGALLTRAGETFFAVCSPCAGGDSGWRPRP